MFLLNSCLSLFSAASLEAPLLPKLRGHFAEFLNNASPVGLRILSSSTCVGLRYGYGASNSSFSWHRAHMLPYFSSVHITSSDCMADLPTILLPRLFRSFHSRIMLSPCVPTVLLYCSTGISTCCPSDTYLYLSLGPTYPGQISFTLETLDIRPEGFSPSSRYSFRHSLFLILHHSFQYGFAELTMLLYQSCKHDS